MQVRRRLLRPLGCGNPETLLLDPGQQIVQRSVQSARVVAGPEMRPHLLLDHALGDRVRNRAFQRAGDLDAGLPVLGRDHQQQAVADSAPADLPGRTDAIGEVLDRFHARARNDHERHLRAVVGFEAREPGFERRAVGGAEHTRQVDDTRQRRNEQQPVGSDRRGLLRQGFGGLGRLRQGYVAQGRRSRGEGLRSPGEGGRHQRQQGRQHDQRTQQPAPHRHLLRNGPRSATCQNRLLAPA